MVALASFDPPNRPAISASLPLGRNVFTLASRTEISFLSGSFEDALLIILLSPEKWFDLKC